jgi:mRNA interferase MazF
MTYNQGDIVIVPFPFTDLRSSKVRPAIVVSNTQINCPQDIILAQISSQRKMHLSPVEFTNSDVTTPLKGNQSHYIYFHKIAVVEKRLIRKKISSLVDEKMDYIITEIKMVFDKE